MLNRAMELAIQSSLEGVKDNEGGPFGAAIVYRNQVIAVAHNTVLKNHDPTCHAEMNAIRLASQHLQTHMLEGCEIYSTVEPCPMCMSAIYWARISKIFVGAPKEIAEKYGFDDVAFYNELHKSPAEREIPCEGMAMDKQVEQVFKTWQSLNRVLY